MDLKLDKVKALPKKVNGLLGKIGYLQYVYR